MPEDRPKWLDEFETLRTKYREHLPAELSQIRGYWKQWQKTGWDRSILETLQGRVHKLAGSGGTFGFSSISDAAKKLDAYLQDLLDQSKTPPLDILSAGGQLLDDLDEALSSYDRPSGLFRAISNATLETGETFESRGDATIFLVDDDEFQAQAISEQLGHFGYHPVVFNQPEDALAEIEHRNPAAIIMDISFPTGPLAGTAAISHQQEKEGSSPPVIFMSARGDMMARLRAHRANAVSYLTKPVEVRELVEQLDNLTGQAKSEPYRVLIVEDQETLAEYYGLLLRRAGMETRTIEDPLRVLDILIEFKPDLIVLDYHLPGCNGVELAAVLHQHRAYMSLPIVFLTTERDPMVRKLAMSLGTEDFLLKPVKPDRLISTVSRRAKRARSLASLISGDGLTGLLNHSHLNTQLEHEILRARRYGDPVSFAMLDLDHFKSVNDTYGHAEGDRVLKSLARLLKQRVRRSDIVGRYGGEEFGIIFTNTDVDIATKVVEEIKVNWSRVRHACDGSVYCLTLSGGVAGFPSYPSATELLEAADSALYEAKNSGRNAVVAKRKYVLK